MDLLKKSLRVIAGIAVTLFFLCEEKRKWGKDMEILDRNGADLNKAELKCLKFMEYEMLACEAHRYGKMNLRMKLLSKEDFCNSTTWDKDQNISFLKRLNCYIGASWWWLDTDINACRIGGIFIKKTYRGNGYGKILLEHAITNIEQQYPSKGIVLKVMGNNPIAKKLYNRFGFTIDVSTTLLRSIGPKTKENEKT